MRTRLHGYCGNADRFMPAQEALISASDSPRALITAPQLARWTYRSPDFCLDIRDYLCYGDSDYGSVINMGSYSVARPFALSVWNSRQYIDIIVVSARPNGNMAEYSIYRYNNDDTPHHYRITLQKGLLTLMRDDKILVDRRDLNGSFTASSAKPSLTTFAIFARPNVRYRLRECWYREGAYSCNFIPMRDAQGHAALMDALSQTTVEL